MEISNTLLEEIQGLLIEGEFNSRWALIETYHEVGKIICNNFEGNKTELLKTLSPKVGKSVRSLWYATKFYENYQTLDSLPEGKNITWNKVVTKYLTTPKEKGKCEHLHREVISFEKCEDCGQNLGRLTNKKITS